MVPVLYPFILILIFKPFSVKSQSYCIWGATGNKIDVNGKYLLGSTVNGQPSYIKTIGASCSRPTLSLWRNRAGNAWRISESTGTATVMECSSSTLSRCTAGHWGTSNPDVYAISGSCPEWQCTSITTTQTFRNCNGPFSQHIGVNTWKHNTQNLYLYFVPHLFHWACFDVLDTTTCPTYAYTVTEAGWMDLSGGQSINLPFRWLGTNSELYSTFQVNCIGASISNPTNKPTPRPTKHPLRIPTHNPNSAPTKTNKPTTTTTKPSTTPTTKTSTGTTASTIASTGATAKTSTIASTGTTAKTSTITAPKTSSPTAHMEESTHAPHDDNDNSNNNDDADNAEAQATDMTMGFIFGGIGIGFVLCCLCCSVAAFWYKISSTQWQHRKKDTVPDNDTGEEVGMVQLTYGDPEKKREVMVWLKGMGLSQYYPMFIKNGFDSMESIRYIENMEMLKCIGITRIGHKVQIWTTLVSMRQAGEGNEPSGPTNSIYGPPCDDVDHVRLPSSIPYPFGGHSGIHNPYHPDYGSPEMITIK